MTSKPKPVLRPLLQRPHAFVARLILADVLAKRGEGPLRPKRLVYVKKER